jgi:hypothetical protein
LNVAAIPALLCRNIPLFLPLIGATSVVSITVLQSHNYCSSQPVSASAETLTAIAQCIASRWPMTLRNLQLKELACTADDFSSIQGLASIQTLGLKQTLQGSLSDERILARPVTGLSMEASLSMSIDKLAFIDRLDSSLILAIVRTWSQLTCLTIEGYTTKRGMSSKIVVVSVYKRLDRGSRRGH